ncbi:winged helix DNA-binding domain-containing protein [Dactylosporangium sp. NBC_01737]|uniref:winged helix DNA-binding domain-containing protein n=1 Tax=Dactylosporangium sp. NBC_01737 TaxID=2975959 RepID=UPI002E135205|nr:winged helix DNA-binding domain-containing protein [Dactylosporangium sp. NBC_01737]
MILTRRQLNRTYLQRQLLTTTDAEPDPRPVEEVVAHLVAVQAQEVDAPYVGLWTRMRGLRHDELTAALTDGRVVRGGLLRRTQHLTAGADYRWLKPMLRQRMSNGGLSPFASEFAGLEVADIAAAGRDILRGQSMTRPKLAKQLAERFPGRKGIPLAWVVQHQENLIHPPPSGVWRRRGHVTCALAEDWLGGPLEEDPPVWTLLSRYLASCGPASVADLQNWSGMKRLQNEVERERHRLRVYRDERGQELFDLPDLPVATGEEAAPVRFLPEFDNLVLSHDDRTRIISDEDRARVCPGYSMVHPTFLVDGSVAGLWSVTATALTVTPFRRLSDVDAAAVLEEAGRLREFLQVDVTVRLDQV